MTFAEVAIGLAEPTGMVPDRGDLDLSVNGVTVRVTGRTDMGLVIRVVQAQEPSGTISFPAGARIAVTAKPVDFRRGGESLAALAKEVLKEDRFAG